MQRVNQNHRRKISHRKNIVFFPLMTTLVWTLESWNEFKVAWQISSWLLDIMKMMTNRTKLSWGGINATNVNQLFENREIGATNFERFRWIKIFSLVYGLRKVCVVFGAPSIAIDLVRVLIYLAKVRVKEGSNHPNHDMFTILMLRKSILAIRATWALLFLCCLP